MFLHILSLIPCKEEGTLRFSNLCHYRRNLTSYWAPQREKGVGGVGGGGGKEGFLTSLREWKIQFTHVQSWVSARDLFNGKKPEELDH